MSRLILVAVVAGIMAATGLLLSRDVTAEQPDAPAETATTATHAEEDAELDIATDRDHPEWQRVRERLGDTGELIDGVWTIVIPRDDLDLRWNGDRVPAGAGFASRVYFFPCPCGKMSVRGDLVLLDYEVQDVTWEIIKGRMDVASIGEMTIGTEPTLKTLHFQGQGLTEDLAQGIANAMRWTGEARKPGKINLSE